MRYPIYEGAQNDIDGLIALMAALNPFANKSKSDLEKDKMKPVFEHFTNMLSCVPVWKNVRSTQEEKDEAWARFMVEVDGLASEFKEKTLEEKNAIISSSAGQALWQLSEMANNLKSQIQLIKQRGKITSIAPADTEKYRELYDIYSGEVKTIDESYSGYESYTDFTTKLAEVTEKEKKAKAEYDKYQNEPVLNYINKRVSIKVGGAPKDFNYVDAYNLYDKEVTKQEEHIKFVQTEIDKCFEEMKKELGKKYEEEQRELDTLNSQIQNYNTMYSNLTKDVMDTVKLGDSQAKLEGDVYSIEEFFDGVQKDIKNIPWIAIKKATRENKKLQNSRKSYLYGLRQRDLMSDGAEELTKRMKDLEKYCTKGKTVEEMLDMAREMQSFGIAAMGEEQSHTFEALGLGTIDNEQLNAVNALNEFNKIKEEYARVMSVYADEKQFKKTFEKIKYPQDLNSAMTADIKRFENEELNPYVDPKGKYKEDVRNACVLINKNYAQLKNTKKIIDSFAQQRDEINAKKIDKALLDVEKFSKGLDLTKYEAYGIKPKIDIAAYLKRIETASMAKELAAKDRDVLKPFKEGYEKEAKAYAEFKANKEKAEKAYNAVKGSTAKMTAQHSKMLGMWQTYTMLKNEDSLIKESIMKKDVADTGNRTACRDILRAVQSELKHIRDNAKVGRDSIFKDSNEYTAMIESIDNLIGKPNERKYLADMDMDRVKTALDAIATASQTYLDAKHAQHRLIPSTQRKTRLAFAENLKACVNMYSSTIVKVKAQIAGIKPQKVDADFEKVSSELNNDKVENMDDFIKNIIKPRGIQAQNLAKEKEVAPKVEVKKEEVQHEEKKTGKDLPGDGFLLK